MDPINYLAAIPQEDFTRDIASGFQLGAGIRQVQQQQQAQQLAQQRAAQYQADAAAFAQAPTPQAAAALALKYPDQYEPITKAWGTLSADQQKRELQDTWTIASTLHADRPDLAKQQIDERITAMKNSGQPTQDLEALRDLVDKDPKAAYGQVLHIASALPGGDKILSNLTTLNEDARKGAESEATVAGKQLDNAEKGIGLVAQAAGALAKPGVKPAQVQTMFRTMKARGAITQEQMQGYIDGIPADPKALPDYLRQVQASGMTAAEQTKYTTPTADAQLSANTQITTTRMNNQNQLEVQDRIAKRMKEVQEVKVKHGALGLSTEQNEALFGENGAVTTGRLDPNKINSRTAGIFADAFIRNPNVDFAKISSDINSGRKADAEFSTGKLGNSIRSFNVGIAHLDTLGQLADALGNGDTQAVNRIGNYFATQTGQASPTSFQGAKKIVGDEIVKAIVGAGGGVADREEAGRIIDAANSPAQLKGAIKTVQELMVGQLGGLEQQYKNTTKREDFDAKLSPRALEIRRSHGGAGHGAPAGGAVPAIPTGWTVREH